MNHPVLFSNVRVAPKSAPAVVTTSEVSSPSPFPSTPYSEVVQELTGAQGTLAVISALLASFAFGGLTCVDPPSTSGVSPLVVGVYYVVTTVSIALQLFVCVVCTLLENHGKVARGLSLARSSSSSPLSAAAYEEQLEAWYS
ncbi:hypothetical protein TrRE_jg6605, partial [Triparma retinervis]